jgi:hypothetical protein
MEMDKPVLAALLAEELIAQAIEHNRRPPPLLLA